MYRVLPFFWMALVAVFSSPSDAFGIFAKECPKIVKSHVLPTVHTRSSGILSAVSSLPGDHWTGDFGSGLKFVKWLHEGGQRWWQVLPLNPMDVANSPFSSESALAIDPVYLGLQGLVDLQLVKASSIPAKELASSQGPTDFGKARALREKLLDEAFLNFNRNGLPALRAEFSKFQKENAYWLKEHSTYMVLKSQYGYDFTKWPKQYRDRKFFALVFYRTAKAQKIRKVEFEQFLLDYQWKQLKQYANSLGIAIIGDMPLYMARYGVNVWANREAFDVDASGVPRRLSGYPACNFYKEGQLWGTPVYDWAGLKDSNYRLWEKRMQRNGELYDVVRLDHFLGLLQFYHVDVNAKNALAIELSPAGGRELLTHLRKKFGSVALIAEDLGASIPPELHKLREDFGIPGMNILQFGYGGSNPDPFHSASNYKPLSVAYTGNHDMQTLKGWMKSSTDLESLTPGEWMKRICESRANLVILPLQDVLGLEDGARMNQPGTWPGAPDPANRRNNWVWRAQSQMLADSLSARMLSATQSSGRD